MTGDPYSTPTRYWEADLKAWNAEIERSKREYARNPIACCLEPGCDDLGTIEAGFCWAHAITYRLCVQCQARSTDFRVDGTPQRRCWTCRKGGKQTAAERMRLRRARWKAQR